ncbi:MAG: gamma-glutamylcyclotransferase [Planctomycetes bacterium]|nr:gamma-glutamylcyclotransferase [Planctomycetota bacterium]
MHVFTYGTLMFPEVWQTVVGRQFAAVEGTASGFAIYRVEGAVFPGIVVASERDVVRGVVYLDVDHASVARLDLFEDEFYERQTLWIDCADGERRAADAYVVPPANQNVLTQEPWQRAAFIASGGLEQFIRRFQGFARVERAADQ